MADKLQELEEVEQISPSVIRILGGNPGKFTLQGTNTYLISSPEQSDDQATVSCLLVDTGEGCESYTALLRSVLQGTHPHVASRKRQISHIILTHWHHDHVGGLRPVLELLQALDQSPPRIYKFHDPDADAKVIDHVGDLPSGLLHHARSEEQEEQRGKSNLYLHHLSDGDQLRPDDHGKPVTLQVVHSPGHTVDHICLLLREEGILLTGDHVLGQGTSVFEDLGAYLMSLRKCKRVLEAELDSSKGMQAGCLFPGHGPVVKDGKVALQDYLDHRLDREEQILALLRKPPTDGGSGGVSTEHSSGLHEWTIPNLVSTLYSDYPESLYPAAARGIFLHLRKLALPDDEALQREAVPAIRLDGTRHNGRRVRCVGQGAQSDGQAPKVPEDDPAWLQAMELRWSILHH